MARSLHSLLRAALAPPIALPGFLSPLGRQALLSTRRTPTTEAQPGSRQLKAKSRLGARKGRRALTSLSRPHSTHSTPRRGLSLAHSTLRVRSGPLLKSPICRDCRGCVWPFAGQGRGQCQMEPPSSVHGGVTGKGTTYRAVPRSSTRVEGRPHLVTLCDPVGDGLEFSHGLLVLEVVREGLCPLLQQLHNLS